MSTVGTPVTDATTLGDWVGHYGSLGQQYVYTSVLGTWPAGWGFSTDGTTYNAYTGTDVRPDLLANPGDPTHRVGGCWYGSGEINFTITPPDAGAYKLSLYECYEESGLHREYGIEFIDDAAGTVLQSVDPGPHYNEWISVEFSGTIRVRYVGPNPVATGFFLDPASGGEPADVEGSLSFASKVAFGGSGTATPPAFTGTATIVSHPVVLSTETIPAFTGAADVSRRPTVAVSASRSPNFTGTATIVAHPVVLSTIPGGASGSISVVGRRSFSASGTASVPVFAGSLDQAVARRSSSLAGVASPGAVFLGTLTQAVSRRSVAVVGDSEPPLVFTGVLTQEVSRRSAALAGDFAPAVVFAGSFSGASPRPVLAASGAAASAPPEFVGSLAYAGRRIFDGLGASDFDRFVVRVTVNMVKEQEAPVFVDANVADVGLAFQCQVLGRNGLPMDLAESTARTFTFQKPGSLSVVTAEATLLTDGRDGLLVHRFQPGELDTAGTWRFQLALGFGSGVKHSEILKFKVRGNLPVGA